MTRRTLVSATALVVAAALHVATSPPPTYMSFRGYEQVTGPSFALLESNPQQAFAIDIDLELPADAREVGFTSELSVSLGNADPDNGPFDAMLLDCETGEPVSEDLYVDQVFADCPAGSECLLSFCLVADWIGPDPALVDWGAAASITAQQEVETSDEEREIPITIAIEPIEWDTTTEEQQ